MPIVCAAAVSLVDLIGLVFRLFTATQQVED